MGSSSLTPAGAPGSAAEMHYRHMVATMPDWNGQPVDVIAGITGLKVHHVKEAINWGLAHDRGVVTQLPMLGRGDNGIALEETATQRSLRAIEANAKYVETRTVNRVLHPLQQVAANVDNEFVQALVDLNESYVEAQLAAGDKVREALARVIEVAEKQGMAA